MGGETEAQVSPWTVDSLKEHIDDKIDDLAARLLERAEAQDKAIQKSEAAAEKRFESVNEFRGQLADQVKTFMTRETYEVGHAALESKVDLVKDIVTGIIAEKRGGQEQIIERRQDNSAKVGLIVAVATVINVLFVLVANGVFR